MIYLLLSNEYLILQRKKQLVWKLMIVLKLHTITLFGKNLYDFRLQEKSLIF